MRLGRLASEPQDSAYLCFTIAHYKHVLPSLTLSRGLWGLNSGSHAMKASNLLTEAIPVLSTNFAILECPLQILKCHYIFLVLKITLR